MFNSDSRASTLAIVALGFFLVAAPMAGAVGAVAPTFDSTSSATETQSVSDWTGGETVTGFNASESNQTALEASDVTADGTFEIRAPELDVVIAENSTFNVTNSTNNNRRVTFNHSELDDMPISSGENKSIEVAAIDDTTLDSPNETNITVYLEGVEGRTVRYVGATNLNVGDEDDSDAFAEAGTDGFEIPATDTKVLADDYATLDDEDVAINGTGSTVSYAFANDTAVAGVSSVASDLDAGTWMPASVLTVSDGDSTDAVRVYADEAPDSVDNETDTYAVFDTDENDLDINFGDEYEDTDEVDVTMNSRTGIYHLVSSASSAYGYTNTIPQLNPLTMGGLGDFGQMTAGLGLILFGYRREQTTEEE